MERITFHNHDNGFCGPRAKIQALGSATVVGYVPAIREGEHFAASGGWVNDKAHAEVLSGYGLAPLTALMSEVVGRRRLSARSPPN